MYSLNKKVGVFMNIVENKIKLDINETCELSQDSYYTRNPQDSKVKGLIGPDSPASIFVKSIEFTNATFETYQSGLLSIPKFSKTFAQCFVSLNTIA